MADADGVAEEISPPQTLGGNNKPEEVAAIESLQQDMDLEAQSLDDGDAKANLTDVQNPSLKRAREEGEEVNGTEEDDAAVSKKLKPEKSVEEKRLQELEQKVEEDNKGGEEEEETKEATEQGKESLDAVNLGPKTFSSSVDMFDYFFKLLHHWQPNIDTNEYEYMVLLDLLKKGHLESDKKIGGGVNAFQVRYHPVWKSRCFFLVREDGSADDFSFRKCVDKILPLPDNMKAPANKDDGKKTGGHKKGGRGGHGRRGGFRR
eukprot:TRINITY_DN42189_c0_g1_i1.p1 TRINITY_DN42189_c0_g1~~TRINITY_DN42189_c0_g1_i1.p1  ORF type:complete len:262 (-),score=77.29 TRINITY_DN42189_c0_g1_i1:653-1438(-)